MNKVQISKKLIPCLIAGLIIPLAGFADADQEKPEGRRKGPPQEGPRRDRIIEMFDADGDGKLSEEERATAKAAGEARRAEALKNYDKDGDGKLSKEERQVMIEDNREKRQAEILEKYDADGDGKLSEEERAKVREELGPPPEKRKEMREKALEKFDADGDGELSEEERATARAEMQKRKGPKGERKGPPQE